MSLLSNNKSFEVRTFRNIFGVNTVSVTFEYNQSAFDQTINRIFNKHEKQTRTFVKTEGTSWVEKKGIKFSEVASVEERMMLDELCAYKGHRIPCD